MSEYKFIGQTGQGRTKIDWPEEAQAIVVKLSIVDKVSASQAFEVGVQMWNDGVAKGELQGQVIPLPLPPSYTNKNAASVLYGVKNRFLKRCNDGKAVAIALAQKYGIIVSDELTQ